MIEEREQSNELGTFKEEVALIAATPENAVYFTPKSERYVENIGRAAAEEFIGRTFNKEALTEDDMKMYRTIRETHEGRVDVHAWNMYLQTQPENDPSRKMFKDYLINKMVGVDQVLEAAQGMQEGDRAAFVDTQLGILFSGASFPSPQARGTAAGAQ